MSNTQSIDKIFDEMCPEILQPSSDPYWQKVREHDAAMIENRTWCPAAMSVRSKGFTPHTVGKTTSNQK